MHSESCAAILAQVFFPKTREMDGSVMTLLIKAIVILLCFIILFALGSALYFLVTDKGDSDHIVKALTWRIGLSVLLFVLLFVAFAFGWLTPHSV